jgi:hypothetical protein
MICRLFYRGADKSLARPVQKGVEKSSRLNWATQFSTVEYDGARSPNVSLRMAWISNDTIDSVLRHREVGRGKDLSAPLAAYILLFPSTIHLLF